MLLTKTEGTTSRQELSIRGRFATRIASPHMRLYSFHNREHLLKVYYYIISQKISTDACSLLDSSRPSATDPKQLDLSYVSHVEVLKKVEERHEVYTSDSGVW